MHPQDITKTTPWQKAGSLRAELERRVRSGETHVAEQLLAAHHQIAADRDAALELIYVEYALLDERGNAPPADAVYARFPQWSDDLREVLQVHHAIKGETPTGPLGVETPVATPAIVGSGPGLDGLTGYQIIAEIGRGGMGVIYKARQEKLDRLVAVKIIRSPLAGAAELVRFRKEAEAAAAVKHPGIVSIYDVGNVDDRPYIAMELVEGGTLVDCLADGPMAPDRAAEVASQIAEAVHAAHEKGVVHRDLKPGNILLDENGIPKITDFGLAKRRWREDGTADRGAMTETQAILGTPSYMAPEQAAGAARDVGPAADVYALGAILYEMLAGVPPFQGDSTLQLADAQPGHVPFQVECGEGHQRLGKALQDMGTGDDAFVEFEVARKILEPIVTKNPGRHEAEIPLALACTGIGCLNYQLGDFEQSIAALTRSIELLAAHPDDPLHNTNLAACYHHCAMARAACDQTDGALEDWESALRFDDGSLRTEILAHRAKLFAQQGDYQAAGGDISGDAEGKHLPASLESTPNQ